MCNVKRVSIVTKLQITAIPMCNLSVLNTKTVFLTLSPLLSKIKSDNETRHKTTPNDVN